MTDKEILIAKLTIFLKKYSVYDSYIAGLAENGCNGKTINEIAEWCIENESPKYIIDHSFYWDFVPLINNQTSWGYLNREFRQNYNTLPYEELKPDPQWDNMWEE